MSDVRVELGDTVKHTITGFQGVVVAVTEWLSQCRRAMVQSTKLSKEGSPLDAVYFDEPELIIVKRAKKAAPLARTGGYKPPPKRTGH